MSNLKPNNGYVISVVHKTKAYIFTERITNTYEATFWFQILKEKFTRKDGYKVHMVSVTESLRDVEL